MVTYDDFFVFVYNEGEGGGGRGEGGGRSVDLVCYDEIYPRISS